MYRSNVTRRNLLRLIAGVPSLDLSGQGVATRGAKPTPRGKPSGIPFLAHFTDVAQSAGLREPTIYGGVNRKDYIVETMGGGCAFLAYHNDGKLDLFVSNCLDFDKSRAPKPGENTNCTFKNVPVNCGPRGLPTGLHSLFRNNGDGTFTDVTEASGIAKIKGRYGLTPVAADFDNDGWPDIFVACDSSASLLLMNNRDGTFREEGLERGAALSDDGVEQAGMGVGI